MTQIPTTEQLITLGRDREAVASAITRGVRMDAVAQLDEVIKAIRPVVDGIRPDQLDAPTPCDEYTVTGVLQHMIDGATHFSPVFRGGPSPAAPTTPESTTEHWHRMMTELLAAVHTPGSQERDMDAPFGTVPATTFTAYTCFDGLIHGWDLATATGQQYAPSDALVADIEAAARQIVVPGLRNGDTFAAETTPPAGASPLERLVAFSGRHVPNS